MAKELGVFDYIKMLSTTKKIPEFDEHFNKKYSPFLVNRFFSLHNGSTTMIVNELNKYNMSKEQHFMFLYHTIRKGNRWSKWPKRLSSNKIKKIQEVFNYSEQKAKAASEIISDKQMKEIDEIFYKGGVTK